MNTLKPRIASLLQQLNERVFEKEHIVALALLLWGIERSVFFNGREKWAKDFENQRV